MKNPFKKIALFFTILFAKRMYSKYVKLADKRYVESLAKTAGKGEKQFVALDFDTKKLSVYSRKTFRFYKKNIENSAARKGNSVLMQAYSNMGMKHLHEGAFYFTGIDNRERELRRLTFINFFVVMSGLKK